jgi:hypothetical protein
MCGTYDEYEREEKCMQDFGRQIWRKEAAWMTWHRWEGNIKMDFKEFRCEGLDWIHVAQTRDQ